MPIFAKFDASMPWHDKIAELPSDSVRWAFVKAICAAKQRESPEFSKPALTEALGTHAKHIPTLVKARLIDVKGSKFSIHDFDDHQAPFDETAALRMRRYRQRKKERAAREHESDDSPQVDYAVDNRQLRRDSHERVTRDGDVSVQRDVTVQSSTGISKRERSSSIRASDDVPDEESELDALVGVLVMANVWHHPTKKMIGFLAKLVEEHTQPVVEAQIGLMLKNGAMDQPEDFLSVLAHKLRSQAIERNETNDRARVEADRKQIEREQEQIERIRSQPGAEEAAKAHREAIAKFAEGLGSPPQAAKPRGSTEGRQSA